MSDPTDPDEELRRRRAALDRRLGPDPSDAPPPHPSSGRSDLARGLKLSSEFIAGVVVGTLLGFAFDYLLGTAPLGLIVFLLLGFAAGVVNVMRETGAMARPETRMGASGSAAPPNSAPTPGPRAGDPAMYDDEEDD